MRLILLAAGCLYVLLAGLPDAQAGSNSRVAADVLRIALPATAYGMTFYNHDAEGRGQFWKSFLTSVGITYGLKLAINHDGPNGHARSFPSGHAATAFSGASFIQRRYGWRLGAPAYAAAAFVGWSRVDSDDHDSADVVAGAAISILSTYLFTTKFHKGMEIVPAVKDESIAVKILGRW